MPKRVVLSMITAGVVALPLSVAACSQSPDAAPGISTTYPIYTPTVGPGDPRTTAASAVGSNAASDSRSGAGAAGVTPSSATAVSLEPPESPASSGSAPGASDTAALTPQPGTVSSTTMPPTTTIWPSQPTVTLAPSLIVTMTIAPGVDTTGIDIEGAKKAYYGFVHVGDEAMHDPKRNWANELSKYARDPAAAAALDEIASYARGRNIVKGHAAYSAIIQSATSTKLIVETCVDTYGLDIVDSKSGMSMKDELGGHHPQHVIMTRTSSTRWLVTSIQGFPRESC